MTYEEAKDRLDKHAQYCLDGQDLYALEIVLEQSINKSVIENIKAEIDCINREEALKLFTWTNTKEDIWYGLKDLPSVQPMLESYQEEKKADKKQVKSAMEGFTSFMRAICNNDKLGVPKEMADEFGISEEYRRKRIMTDYKKYINALRKCANEHENDKTFTGHIIVSDLCKDTADLLEELEQEPKTDFEHKAEVVISQLRADRDRLQDAIEKIKSEIKEWYWQADKQALAKDPCVVDAMIDLFIRTIDKYTAESEKV